MDNRIEAKLQSELGKQIYSLGKNLPKDQTLNADPSEPHQTTSYQIKIDRLLYHYYRSVILNLKTQPPVIESLKFLSDIKFVKAS